MKIYYLTIASIFLISISSCRNDDLISEIEEEEAQKEIEEDIDIPDWTESTHAKGATLDYSVVFNQNEVLRFDIKIDSDDWDSMQDDLADNLGSTSGPGGGGPGGGGNSLDSDYDPIWVPCSFNFDKTEWYKVGVRFKGNSSLLSAYQSGNNKLSLKLDFDEFEDDYPAIKNQRFYGFKQLNLNNNYNDSSLMREKVAADLFRQFGLPAANTAFCVVYIDNGNGPQYYGVYAIVEEVDDTVLETQFADDSGNLYKPDGDAATFANGTYDTSELYLKTNEDLADYSDTKALYDIINSSERTSDVESWKDNLEKVLNVDHFLKWLAANTVIQNWDTYGNMTHNYYIYTNPEDGLITWIPWDNNEAFEAGKQSGALSFGMSEVSNDWPLISNIIDQDEYSDIYKAYLEQFITEVFIPSEMSSTYSTYYDLIKEYAFAEEYGYSFITSSSDFTSAVETLKSHAQSRNTAVNSYLD